MSGRKSHQQGVVVKRVEKKHAGMNHKFHKRRLILDLERPFKSGVLYLIPTETHDVNADKYIALGNVIDVYFVKDTLDESSIFNSTRPEQLSEGDRPLTKIMQGSKYPDYNHCFVI